MKAADVMVCSVISVRPNARVEEVASILLASRISAVPVIDEQGELLGIVSEGDLMWLLDWRASPEVRMPHGKKKLSICDRNAIRAWIREGAKEIATVSTNGQDAAVASTAASSDDRSLFGFAHSGNLREAQDVQ